ncbi:MAG: hypothetical protein HOP12_10420 [Candidatus Eisenbacteria bacterium]|uniref:Haem-binding uptake Tiki superfamily ChaN domain-containing protein n=1 Tax=Eiseniibacteriota bacterium TaxID=2212470 RepID=A0A849SGS0_UNCEI|nr:hypothetical protein [Candidatus Eisenbacteria bacterium]
MNASTAPSVTLAKLTRLASSAWFVGVACFACLASDSSAIAAPALTSADSALARLLPSVRSTLELRDGKLVGPAAGRLLQAAREARFVGLGEDHGIREVPAVAQALLAELSAAGFRHLAIEVSPFTAGRLAQLALAKEPESRLAAHFRDTLDLAPFYTLFEERALLGWWLGAAGGKAASLWGVDYEVFADRAMLRRLDELATSAAAHAVIARALSQAEAGVRANLAGDPSQLYLWNTPDADYEALRRAIAPARGSEADRVLEQMEISTRINRAYLEGRGYDSNLERSQLMKRNFMNYYRAAQAAGERAPRVFLKLGANHVQRGRTETQVHDLGSLVADLAEAEGGSSFTLLVVGGAGTEQAAFNIGKLHYDPVPNRTNEESWAVPFHAAALPTGWTLFDLRAVRSRIRGREFTGLSESARRVLYGYDAMLILGGSGASRDR